MHKSKKDAIEAQIKTGKTFRSYKQFADAAGVGRSTALKYNSLYGGVEPLIIRAYTQPTEAQAIKAASKARSIREFAAAIDKPYKSAYDYVDANPSIRQSIARNAEESRLERYKAVIASFDRMLNRGMEMRAASNSNGHSCAYYYKCCKYLGVTPYHLRGKAVKEEKKISTMSVLLSRPLVGVAITAIGCNI